MIDSYEIIGKDTVVIKENGNETVVSCNNISALDEKIIEKNNIEYLSNVKKDLSKNLKVISKAIKNEKIIAISYLLTAVLIFGNSIHISSFNTDFLNKMAIIQQATAGLLTCLSLVNIKSVIKRQNNRRNLSTILHNIDMKITRIINDKNVKENNYDKYLIQDKSNIKITNIAVDKLISDAQNSIHNNWYGLNSKCCIILNKKIDDKKKKEALLEIFAPISTSAPLETKRYVKTIINNRNKNNK